MTTPTTVNVRLQLRADTAANWTAANPTLLANEVGLETDTKKLKVGNGSAAWNSLAYFPSIVSGGTVLGNLEIGSTGTLTFEGSTADGFETTLAVTNPTADRTITLPNVSGTVVTTGDTGSVTSTMIADGTIVNGDINASAAIAGTKISPDFGSQTVTTTGVVSAAAGAAATPSIAFTGDTNTGIYSPGADQVAISTGGSGRLFVDASGNVGAGTSSPASRLHVDDGFITTGRYGNLGALILRRANGTAAAPTQITSAASIAGVYARGLNELGAYNNVSSVGFGSDGAITSTSSPGFFVVETTPSSSTSPQERLRITSAGLVGVGTSSPAFAFDLRSSSSTDLKQLGITANDWSTSFAATYLQYHDSAATGTTAGISNARLGSLAFQNVSNALIYTNGATPIIFGTTSAERMRISNGGKIYANTTADPVGPSDVIIHAARTNGNAFGATVTTSGYTCYTVSSVTNGYAMWMYNTTASANVGSILINTASVSYTTTSDYRLKENVTTINDGITRLQQLKPSRFNFIADPDTTVDGFIAHEVQTVVPEAITGKKDAVDDDGNPIYQGIDQSKLVPLLTAALQEAIAKIESLEARLIAAGI